MNKVFPKVGDELYLYQKTGNSWVDMVKRPYSVIAVTPGTVVIQSAKCIFPKPCYYNTMPDRIEADSHGEVLVLHWANKKGKWQIDKYNTGYPEYAEFGKFQYYPYLA